jgi:WD40 repeat protein
MLMCVQNAYTGGVSNEIHKWNVLTGEHDTSATFQAVGTGCIWALKVFRGGKEIVTTDSNGWVVRWDSTTGKVIQKMNLAGDCSICLTVLNDRSVLRLLDFGQQKKKTSFFKLIFGAILL